MKVREQMPTSHIAKFSSRGTPWPRSVLIEMALEQRAVGRRIAELREGRRLTQPVVAERVGVSLRAYQKWEAGTSAPAWRNLEHLAEVLGVSADELLGLASEATQTQLDRIEAEVTAIRVELATLATQLEEWQQLPVQRRGTAASRTRSRTAK